MLFPWVSLESLLTCFLGATFTLLAKQFLAASIALVG